MKPGIVRELYLRSTPYVDLDLLNEGEQVNCCDHTIPMSVYDEVLNEYCENDMERTSVNMWMVMSGPQLVND